ncbi:zinc-binding dehydrogenase [Phlyctema vagabunda]|uniref:Zinc-binding dehydrogenase n=1 Tax=Phlyctema vagabunda TaxID=108571 RepID=A0ABR4P308_9HELO
MTSNTAAWLNSARAYPLEIKAAPYTKPSEGEIVVRNHAVAINPVDWKLQELGGGLFSWVTYPTIPAYDVSGVIAEVGSGVTQFKVGDRVLGMSLGLLSSAAEGACQEYVVVKANLACKIPDSLSHESASVLPLTLCTAACGMFQKDFLALNYPSHSPEPTGETLLVWGGSTSVGINAIQLAVAAGYEVIATASPKNFDFVKKHGASAAFDYNSPTVVEDIVAAFEGKTSAGAIAIGNVSPGTLRHSEVPIISCLSIVAQIKGRKFVASAAHLPENLPAGAEAKFIFGNTLKDNEVGKVIFEDFLPHALAQGKYAAVPEPIVVGKGLEYVQEAFEVQKRGVSARKVVVSL